jgi:predicted phosphoserine aminotransferase
MEGRMAVSFGRFFLPGPTEVRPEVLQAQVAAMIGHRGPAIQGLMGELQPGLQALFATERPVLVSTSSATGFMEAAIRNGAGGRVLALVNGAFSQRFADIARACGQEVDELAVPWGEAHDPDEVADTLRQRRYAAVTVVHSETSTGVLNDLPALAGVVRESRDTFLLVDSVPGVGGAEMRADDWGLDFVLTGSQKALALPPGLAFAVASERMMARSADMPGKGTYFDLMAFAGSLEKLQTPNTPALSLLYALRHQLERIAQEGVEGRLDRHRAMAERTWAWVDAMREHHGVGTEVMAPAGFRSPTVTAIRLSGGLTGPPVVSAMRERGWVIGAGYGALKESTIRIGHMGDHTLDELNELLGVLEEVVR